MMRPRCAHRHLRVLRRRGVGLTEVAIAMAIILIVSIAATGLITRFAANNARAINYDRAINLVDNALECFKFSGTQREFNVRMLLTVQIEDWPATNEPVYVYEGIEGYVVYIKVVYGYSGYLDQFGASVQRTDNNRTVYSVVDYTKYSQVSQ